MKHFFTLFLFATLSSLSIAQTATISVVTLVGYVYESNNRGYLNEVKIVVQSKDEKKYRFYATTNKQGKFEVQIPVTGGTYTVEATKRAFRKTFVNVSTKGKKHNQGIFTKVEMSRMPGYVLEMSLTDLVSEEDPAAPAYGIEGAHIEVYNNTTQEEVLNIAKHPNHMIECHLEQGNEYVFLIRKEGYYAKRMRANVNVNGCILCMEGFGTVTPRVTENLTRENSMGSLGANVMLKKMVLNETMKIEDIYYDLGKATLRPEAYAGLDNLAKMMYDNPQLIVELSSHTDCRGSSDANMNLSQRRANSVVNYIKSRVKLKDKQIEAKGYGETRPVNSCVDGVYCTEQLHQQNRRTEVTVIDIIADDDANIRSLSSMMQEYNFDLILDANNEAYSESGTSTELYHRSTPSKPQSLTIDYSGYKIQMIDKEGDLTTNHFMFYEFDEVYLDVLKERHYAFLIGDYKNYDDAAEELKKYKTQFPKAKIIEYQNGIRTN